MKTLQQNLNALIILVIAGIISGAFWIQFVEHEQPCPLCLLQRLGMISVASGLMLNLWFGVRMSHYALSLLSALMGGFVALRQISLHVCPGFATFGLPVLGLSLYTWSFIVFVCCVLAISLLLFLYNPEQQKEAVPPLSPLSKLAIAALIFVTATNIVTSFLQCGFGPCQE